MITAWMLYAIVVGILLGSAGWAIERLLRTHGRACRWVWAGAIFLSAAWPLGHWAWENRPEWDGDPVPFAAEGLPQTPSEPAAETPPPLEAITVTVPAESILRALDGPVIMLWGLVSGVLSVFFVLLLLRTRFLRRQWESGKAGGHSVLFSDEWGPAVVGLIRPQVVLPLWCKTIDDRALRLILDHELEHVRTGDLRLISMMGIPPVLFPWHLPIWWQLARLRTAIEGDCDLRVLGRNPGSLRRYLELLIDVGEKSSGRRPLAVMLSEPYETLKRRIKIMTVPLPKNLWIRGSLLAGCGAVLVALAGWAPAPMDGSPEPSDPLMVQGPADDLPWAGEHQVAPTFTPYTVQPSINNMDAVRGALAEAYPPLLEDASIGGTTEVWFFVDEAGLVQRTLVQESSGHRALDDAAISIANVIEFNPALNRDQPKPVWVAIPIEFTVDEVAEEGGTEAGTALPIRREWSDVPPVEPGITPETGDIAGTTTDAATGQPVAFTQVYVPGTGLGTLSDQEGRFLIRDVPVGARLVVAEMVGFDLPNRRVDVTAEEHADVDFELQPTAITFHKLVVKGRRVP
jgi:TonB family protein